MINKGDLFRITGSKKCSDYQNTRIYRVAHVDSANAFCVTCDCVYSETQSLNTIPPDHQFDLSEFTVVPVSEDHLKALVSDKDKPLPEWIAEGHGKS